MKPTDLTFPVDWNTDEIIIHDHVWYIPKRANPSQKFALAGWQHLFGNQKPVMVEYCSGNGDWIVSRAKEFPELNWIAVEMKFARVRKIWSKIKNLQLSNVCILCAEGMAATRQYFPAESIQNVFVNFPDPWPKNRHAKNRLLNAAFLHEMHRILCRQGGLTLVTDDLNYSEWTLANIHKTPYFLSAYPAPFYSTEMPEYGTSYFEELWRQQGKTIRYHQFTKQESLQA